MTGGNQEVAGGAEKFCAMDDDKGMMERSLLSMATLSRGPCYPSPPGGGGFFIQRIFTQQKPNTIFGDYKRYTLTAGHAYSVL